MYDIIVIGCGVAGMTAALYARRNGMTALVIEQETIGGQISKSPKVENYPTIDSIAGMELAEKIFDQITDKGADFELDTVNKIEKNGDIFTITDDLPKSFIVCRAPWRKSKKIIYLTQISSQTLLHRAAGYNTQEF